VRKLLSNLQLIAICEVLFWTIWFRRAVLLHSAILLFIFKIAIPTLVFDFRVEFQGFLRLWRKYVLKHEMEPAKEKIVRKESKKLDRELAKLLDGE